MANRSYPANTRLQSFYTENYVKENNARLDWYFANKRGGDEGLKRAITAPMPSIKGALHDGLPTINPSRYAIDVRKKELAEMAKIAEEARLNNKKEEMIPVSERERSPLYDGFTKEERGRYQYLKHRHQVIPEEKFNYAAVSSWQYGWKLNDSFNLKRPTYARSRKIKDTFFTRNGVPTLRDPVVGVNRTMTSLF